MALNTAFVTLLARELRPVLLGAKVEKVQMPARQEIILTLRTREGRRDLCLGGGSGAARVHLTEMDYEKPQEPPMFCMLLRKHLIGARVADLTQPEGERILILELDAPGMFGEGERRRLIAELFGRAGNLILTDGEGVITDCLSRVGGLDERRAILPGMRYRLPEKPAGFVPQALPEGFVPAPSMLVSAEGEPKDFSYEPLPPRAAGDRNVAYPTLSALLDAYWRTRSEEDRKWQYMGTLLKTVRTRRDRVARRLEAQRQELLAADDRDWLRECGDIITTNLYTMKKGDTVLTAQDYYSETGGERTIRLDPLKTPQENAARYYKDYARMKSAALHLRGEVARGEEELSWLESVLDELDRAESARDIAQVREELMAAGVLKPEKGKKREKTRPEGPMRFTSSTGMPIRVGRNNAQNDELTTRTAAKTDLWLHTQKIHGSHVVVLTGGAAVDDVTLREAASLAATYSQGREAGRVAVDYALIRHVKKPGGARPGMVTYTDYKTILAAPSPELAERLRDR